MPARAYTMSLDKVEIRWIADKCATIVLAAVDGDSETVAQSIMAVGIRHDDTGVYSLCCGLAEAIVRMARLERGGRDSWHGLEVVAMPSGKQINPEQVPPKGQGHVKAAQFLTAFLNDDTSSQLALFAADPVLVSTGLAKLVAVYGRQRLAENRAAGEQP